MDNKDYSQIFLRNAIVFKESLYNSFEMIMNILLVVLNFVVIFWLVGFFISNDFFVPSKDVRKYKKVLVVFPHADDEALSIGGLLSKIASEGGEVTYLLLTKGERGTEDAHLETRLKAIRTQEAKDAARILGITTLIQKDLGDGELIKKKSEITKIVDQTIKDGKPDLIITYDLAGLYGHDDHIAASEVVTDLVKKKYKSTALWYTTQPKRVLAMLNLPEHMATDPEFRKRRVEPTHKVFVGTGVLKKIQATYAYQSQFESIKKGFPFQPTPPAFLISTSLFEYFYEAN